MRRCQLQIILSIRVRWRSGNIAGYGADFTVAKGQQRHELTLSAEWLRKAIATVSALRRDGSVNGAAQNAQPSGGCRSPQEAALPAYGNNKVLYLLIFIA